MRVNGAEYQPKKNIQYHLIEIKKCDIITFIIFGQLLFDEDEKHHKKD
jgi:hypothetical protein